MFIKYLKGIIHKVYITKLYKLKLYASKDSLINSPQSKSIVFKSLMKSVFLGQCGKRIRSLYNLQIVNRRLLNSSNRTFSISGICLVYTMCFYICRIGSYYSLCRLHRVRYNVQKQNHTHVLITDFNADLKLYCTTSCIDHVKVVAKW